MASTLIVVLAGLGGCSNYGDGYTGPTNSDGAVTVGAESFTNPTVRPGVGGVVTWTWKSGGVTHNILFEDHNGGASDRATGSYSRTFYVPGTYRYRCTIHSTDFGKGMSGQVIMPQSANE